MTYELCWKGFVMVSKEIVRQEIQISPNKKLAVTISWCKSCGICMELCPREVLGAEEVTKKVILIAPEKCNGCGLCELSCPDYVFTIQELEDILA
jgi:2-oxoglutarate ferredoxin oxidoreductase subunit delta